MMELKTDKRSTGIVLMLVCTLLWSLAGLMVKLMPWPPMVITGLRGAAAALFMLFYLLVSKRKIVFSLRSALIALAVAATSLLYVFALKLTTAANAIVLQYTSSVFLVVFSAIFFKKKFRKLDLIIVAATMLGIVLFFLDELTVDSLVGILLALIDGMVFACVYMLTGESDMDTRLSGLLGGYVIMAVAGLPFVLTNTVWTDGTAQLPILVLLVIVMGVFQVALPYVLYCRALRSCPPLACALIASFEILLNPLWVFVFKNEVPGKWAFVGGVVIFLAVTCWCVFDTLLTRKQAKEAIAAQ